MRVRVCFSWIRLRKTLVTLSVNIYLFYCCHQVATSDKETRKTQSSETGVMPVQLFTMSQLKMCFHQGRAIISKNIYFYSNAIILVSLVYHSFIHDSSSFHSVGNLVKHILEEKNMKSSAQ